MNSLTNNLPASSPATSRLPWPWILAGAAALAFLVTFLLLRREKARHKALKAWAKDANEVMEGVVGLLGKHKTKTPTKNTIAEAEVVPGEDAPPPPIASPVQTYEIPVIRPALNFQVKPMPSPYTGAVRLQAWHNSGYRYVDVIRDPAGRFAESFRREQGYAGDGWVLQLCHLTGTVNKTLILPIEGAIGPDGARISNEIKTLLTITTTENADDNPTEPTPASVAG